VADPNTEKAQPDEIDLFGVEVARNLRELIEDGTPADEWASYLEPAIEALLTCHDCGTHGLPSTPCCDDDEEGQR